MGAEVMRYDGDPIDVNAVLASAPEEPSRERPTTPDPYRALIIERGLFLRELGAGKDAITCPFEKEHSEATSDTATGRTIKEVAYEVMESAYLRPAPTTRYRPNLDR